MRPYQLVNVHVYVDENSRGKYMWANAELRDFLDEYNNTGPAKRYPLFDDLNVAKWFKCARQNTQYVAANGKRTEWIVDENAVTTAIATQKFADGSECVHHSFDPNTFEQIDKPDNFRFIRNIDGFDINTPYPVVRIAIVATQVTVNGQQRTIPAGEPIPNRHGEIVPVTSIHMWVKCDDQGKPVEDVNRRLNNTLERFYRRATPAEIGATGPIAPPDQQNPINQEQQRVIEQQQQAQQALFGGITTPQQPAQQPPVQPMQQPPLQQ